MVLFKFYFTLQNYKHWRYLTSLLKLCAVEAYFIQQCLYSKKPPYGIVMRRPFSLVTRSRQNLKYWSNLLKSDQLHVDSWTINLTPFQPIYKLLLLRQKRLIAAIGVLSASLFAGRVMCTLNVSKVTKSIKVLFMKFTSFSGTMIASPTHLRHCLTRGSLQVLAIVISSQSQWN